STLAPGALISALTASSTLAGARYSNWGKEPPPGFAAGKPGGLAPRLVTAVKSAQWRPGGKARLARLKGGDERLQLGADLSVLGGQPAESGVRHALPDMQLRPHARRAQLAVHADGV